MFKKIIKIFELLLDDAVASLENSRKLREEQERRHLEFEQEFKKHREEMDRMGKIFKDIKR